MADQEFTRSARRPPVVVDDPILQWASGLTTTDRRIYAGWMLEAGKFPELDGAMHEAGFPQVTIKHGNGNTVTHWAVETANAFVIADGVQTPQECRKSDERFGIAYGWRTTEDGRRQSQLKCRVLLRELLSLGCYQELIITVKSTQTDDMIRALMRQYDVLGAVDVFRAEDKKPALNPPFYAASLPLTAGEESTRGTGANTKLIIPPTAAVPAVVTRDYIKANWIKRDWTAYIESVIEQTIAWSVEESARIGAGIPERQ